MQNWCLYAIHSWQEKYSGLVAIVDILFYTYNQSWHLTTLGLDQNGKAEKKSYIRIFFIIPAKCRLTFCPEQNLYNYIYII